MRATVESMGFFEAMQPQLRGQPASFMHQVATRARNLDEALFALQRKGLALQHRGEAAEGPEGRRFAAELEAFAAAHAAFVEEVGRAAGTLGDAGSVYDRRR